MQGAEEIGQGKGNKKFFFLHLFTGELYLTSKVRC